MDISILQNLNRNFKPLSNHTSSLLGDNSSFQSMIARQGFNPGIIAPAIQSNTTSSNFQGGTLYMGCLVSMGSGNGQELHMNYDESSTEEEPVILAWGKDITGQEFTRKIYVNDINPEHASPAEMIALNAHLSKQGDKAVQNNAPIPLWASLNGYDANAKLDFKQYFEEWISMQSLAGNKQDAALYQFELERYLFFSNTDSEA